MKSAIQQFFRGFDLFTAPAGLRVNSSETLNSRLLGFISVLIFGALIYLLVINWIGVMKYQQITFQLSQTMILVDQAYGEIRMGGVTMGFIAPEKFQMFYDFHWNYYQNGVRTQRSRMLRQGRPQQWTDLGDNYNTTFYGVGLNDMYCPNITSPYKLKQTLSQENNSYVSITSSVCDKAQRPGCFSQMAGAFIYNRIYAKVWFYYLDTQISPTNIDSTSYFVNTNKAILTYWIRQYVQLSFTKFQIDTDMSIWPVSNTETIQGMQYASVKNNPTFYDVRMIQNQVMAELVLSMNNRIKIYTRTIGKFDQIVSYVGGLFGIIFALFAWFLMSYNKYRFEIKVAQGAFNYDEGGMKIKQSNFNFFTYIKYTIYLWIKSIFCCKLKWKDCNEIDEVREEINKQMDVSKMFLRLQATERIINYKIEDNEETCINLREPPFLAQVKDERIQLDYYDEVIKGNSAATLADLLNLNAKQKQIQNNQNVGIDSAKNVMTEQMRDPQALASVFMNGPVLTLSFGKKPVSRRQT